MSNRLLMRFRTDARYIAEAKALGREYADFYGTREVWDATPPAEPGDTWRALWFRTEAVAGYDICCPICKHVHAWTTALNCRSRRTRTGTREDGTTFEYVACDHSTVGSCWRWTGSAEDGTLSASPSLWCQQEKGGCGFHGYLTNGELRW